MGILFSEVKYYASESVDFDVPSSNGGAMGIEIVNDTLHSIFPEISATERETGFTRYSKIFIFNESTTRIMQDCIFYIKQDVLPEDRLKMFAATEQVHIDFDNKTSLTATVVAGTSIEIENILPSGTVAGDIVGRKTDIAGSDFTVASSADDTHIAFAEDITSDVGAGYTISTNDEYDFYEDDEDFVTGKEYVNSVIRSTVTLGVTEIYISILDKLLFEVGDDVVICDGYFRAVYRGGIDSIVDHGVDEDIAIITLDKAYTSTSSIPTDEGYISNGLKISLSPGEGRSFWLELKIASSDAIDAEVINQFQVGTHFDDITA